MRHTLLAFCTLLVCSSCFAQTAVANSATSHAATARVAANYGKLPLAFERNQGQADTQVKFLARGQGYTLFLTSGEAVLAVPARRRDSVTAKATASARAKAPALHEAGVLHMKFLGANPATEVTGVNELPGRSNYFIGSDAKQWQTNVPLYAKVRYQNLYSGIDLIYYGNQRQLEYDFVVARGADPRRIEFVLRGARQVRRGAYGDLVVKLGEGELRWHRPLVYQEKGGTRQAIAAHYVIKDKSRVGFQMAAYDTARPLFIDPLVYSTFLGGNNTDVGNGIAIDSAGNAYVTGYTQSTNFPTANPLQPANGGGQDVFVAKVNPTGSALVYSTYLGGSGNDAGNGIAVDSAGNVYVTGQTYSTNFPTMNPLQSACGGCPTSSDAFVTELNPTGSALAYSTYLGGSYNDAGHSIAVDSAGDAYVTGETQSGDFPTVNPLQPANGGGNAVGGDAFVTKVNPTGSALVYSTYLGGSDFDEGEGIAVDSVGNAYVTGQTWSTDFPTMNPLQPACGSCIANPDAFVAKLNPTGSALVYSTYLGGSALDQGYGIAADSAGNAYVTGYTFSTDFPTVNALQPKGGGDVFLAKFNPTGSALVYSTYLGGSNVDIGRGIAVDSAGNAYVAGYTFSTDFPTANPLQAACSGGCSKTDAFVAQINSTGSALVYSTYLGGGGEDKSYGIAVDSAGNAYVTGYTYSSSFPIMNPLQPTCGSCPSSSDAFIAKISTPGPPAVTLSPTSLAFGNQAVNTTSPPKTVKVTNTGGSSLTISSISASANFAVSSTTCGATLLAGKSCSISVTFTPPALGSFAGTLTITDNAPNSPQTVALSGTGVLPATLKPASATYASQAVGTTSAAKTFTLTNNQSVTLNNIAIGFTGANPGDFSVSSTTCGSTLAAKSKCTINVVFTPKATGTRTATLSVSDDASNSPQTSALTGTGT